VKRRSIQRNVNARIQANRKRAADAENDNPDLIVIKIKAQPREPLPLLRVTAIEPKREKKKPVQHPVVSFRD
jgi:hypothetical protein